MTTGSVRLTLGTRIALAGAAVWSLLLIGLGFMPTYQSETATPSGAVARSTQTLVSENGYGVLVLLAIPLVVTVVVSLALGRRSRTGLVVAWTLTGVVAAITGLGMLTIGIFVLPAAAALVVACTLCSTPPSPAVGPASTVG